MRQNANAGDDPSAVPRLVQLRDPLLLAIALWLPMLLLRDAWPVDETRYADVALAMTEQPQAWVPVLHQKWYLEKPPGFFWAIVGLARLGVPIERGPMAVSLLASLGTLALLPRIGRACGLAAAAVRRAAFCFVTAPLVAVYAQLGYIDPLLAFECTAALACALARTTLPIERRGARVGWALLEGVALAAALLTKGPVALLFALGARFGALVALPEVAASQGASAGRARASGKPGRFERLDLLVFGVAVGLALAWVAKARLVAGAEYIDALIFGQLERRVAGTEKKHRKFLGFALTVVLAGGLPWSALALGALRRDAAAPSRWRPSARLGALLGASLLPCVSIALLPTQQPHYVLPALPALALLAGVALEREPRRAGRRVVGSVGGLLGAALLGGAAWLACGGSLGQSVDAGAAAQLRADVVLQGLLAAAGASLCVVTWLPARASGFIAARRSLLGTTALLAVLPWMALRVDRLLAARDLCDAPAVKSAARLIAPTGLRSELRLATRLPRIEEHSNAPLLPLLLADPELVAVIWEHERVERGLADGTEEVARGWLQGRAVIALKGARR